MGRLQKFISTVFLATVLLATACREQVANLDVAAQMNLGEQQEFVYDIIRYIGKLPGKANDSTKFLDKWDPYYRELSKRHQLRYYGKQDGYEYFLITRIAPSISEKYVAIGGRLKKDAATGELTDFEEIFRTWKMPLPELLPIAEKLLREAMQGKDLSKYYPENSGDEYIIEFPNSEVSYDKAKRVWVSTREDVIKSMQEMLQQSLQDSLLLDSLQNTEQD